MYSALIQKRLRPPMVDGARYADKLGLWYSSGRHAKWRNGYRVDQVHLADRRNLVRSPSRLHRLERTNLDKPSATNSTSSLGAFTTAAQEFTCSKYHLPRHPHLCASRLHVPALRGATSEQLRRPILSVSLERVQAPWVVFQFKYRSDTNLSFQPLRFARSKADQPEEILCVESYIGCGAPWLGAMQPAQYFPAN